MHQFAKVREGVPREYPLLGVPMSTPSVPKGANQNILKYAVHQFAKVREGVPREYFPRCEYPHSEHLPCIVPIKRAPSGSEYSCEYPE